MKSLSRQYNELLDFRKLQNKVLYSSLKIAIKMKHKIKKRGATY